MALVLADAVLEEMPRRKRAPLPKRPATARELVAALGALAPGPLCVVSARGELLYANRAAETLDAEGKLAHAAGAVSRGETVPGWLARPLEDGAFLLAQPAHFEQRLEAMISGCARRWRLTTRQTEVLGALARGASNKEIAHELGCAPNTVELHVAAVLHKAGAETRLKLATLLLRQTAREAGLEALFDEDVIPLR